MMLFFLQIAEQMELPENIAGRHAWTPTHKGKSYVVRGTELHDLRAQTLKTLVTAGPPRGGGGAPQDTARDTAR